MRLSPDVLKLAGLVLGTAASAGSFFFHPPASAGLLALGGALLGWVGVRRPGDVPAAKDAR